MHAGARCPAAPTRTACSQTRTRTARCPRRWWSQELPGAQGLRRVLRLRPLNMVKTTDAIGAGDDPAGGRDHLARVVRPGRLDPADGRRFAARSTRAAEPTRCRVEVAPGSEPNNGRTTDIPPGDFQPSRPAGATGRPHEPVQRRDRDLDLNALKSRFPAATRRVQRPEPIPAPPNFNSRPNQEPFGFVVRLVATAFRARRR